MDAPLSPPAFSAATAFAWRCGLAADRHKAGKTEGCVDADETDQDDFDDAHFSLSRFLAPASPGRR